MTGEPKHQVREALDRAAAARPKLDGDALTEAVKALCRRREALRRSALGAADIRRELRTINTLITLVQAIHYPLAAVPWALLDQARRMALDLEAAAA